MVKAAILSFMKEFKMNAEGHCEKKEYFEVFIKIGKILIPGIEHEDLREIIEDDFKEDAADKLVIPPELEDNEIAKYKLKVEFEAKPKVDYDYLTKDKLYEALYTLCDRWCPSVDQYEYCEFFNLLKFKIKYSNQGDSNAYDAL